MAAANLAEDLKEELTCAVCLEYFNHPVTLGCGHSFCHLCLLRSWEGGREPSFCPECRRAFWMREVQPNHRLRKLASIARNLRPYLLQIREERTMCEKHKEEQNLFCEEDQAFLCASCFQSQEHSSHLVQPINKAAQASRRQTNAWRESVRAEYGRLLDFLKLEENRHLTKLAWDEKQHLQKFTESENRLSQHLQNLKEEMTKTEQICQIPNLQFLEVAGDTSRKIQTLLSKRPDTARNSLARIHITGIFEMMNTFRVNVTLDPESASPYLIVSNDLKTVRNGGCLQNVPMTPDRFEDEIILGTQVFTSGVHYWEVDVGNSMQWTVGVCKESVSRNSSVPFFPGDVFLITYIQNEDTCTVVSNCSHIPPLTVNPIRRVGIFLEYNQGRISFYDVLEKSFLLSCPSCPFSEPLRPIFSPCPPTGEENSVPMSIVHANIFNGSSMIITF
ncbi:putative E3 ubiquitin-protein ligase TRIML1 [Sarcophilus harrisii]